MKLSFFVFILLFSLSNAEEKAEIKKEHLPKEQGQKANGFDSAFVDKTSQNSAFQKKSELFNKKFETSSTSFGKSARGFDTKFESSSLSSSLNKSYPIESKGYAVKSSDLGKESTLQKKSSDLLEKGSAGLDKKFETKAYEGPETPQAQKEIRELLKQKGGDGKSGDKPLSIEEIKQIVNRDSHLVSPNTPTVEVPKESAIDSRTSNR